MPSFEQGRESLDVPRSPNISKLSTEDPNPSTPQKVNDSPATPVHSVETGTTGTSDDVRVRIDKVLQSDIGINTLLLRLKQSISSVKDFSSFLKERATLEERHAQGLRKLARGTHELIQRSDNRQGTYAQNYEEVNQVQDRVAENGLEFAHELFAMSDQLRELAIETDAGRKQWKHTGQEAEQRAAEAEGAMRKAKDKYWQLAEQYDRARTGEKQGGKFGLKTKSPAQQEESLLAKADNADQEYHARVQAAQSQRHELLTSSRPQAVKELQALVLQCDAGLSAYMAKFAAVSERLVLGNGLAMNPLKTGPSGAPGTRRSARESIAAIDNRRDFDDFVLSHATGVPPTPLDIKYEKHPALVSQKPAYGPSNPIPGGPPSQFTAQAPERRGTGPDGFGGPQPPYGGPPGQSSGIVQSQSPAQSHPYGSGPGHTGSYGPQGGPLTSAPTQTGSYGPNQGVVSSLPQPPPLGSGAVGRQSLDNQSPVQHGNDYRNFSGPPQHRPNQSYSNSPTHQRFASGSAGQYNEYGPGTGRGQPQMAYSNGQQGPGGYPPHQQSPSLQQNQNEFRQGPQYGGGYDYRPQQPQPPQHAGRGLPSQNQNGGYRSQGGPPAPDSYSAGPPPATGTAVGSASGPTSAPAPGPAPTGFKPSNLPALRPVFGVTLDDLFRRDQAAVPAIVYQCVQAVDAYGLTTEGIYRTSGSAQHIMELRAQFDHDSSQVDFRDPAAFYNDIAAVTTLLKHFLRDLKDPLLTAAQYKNFIESAKIDDDIQRRDSLHALINSLPDPNYATLRTLTLHLNRISQHSAQNRMTTSNLAIVFGPTLMGGHTATGGGGGASNAEIKDAGWQARVVETILENTLQIFDDDE